MKYLYNKIQVTTTNVVNNFKICFFYSQNKAKIMHFMVKSI